MVLPLSFLLLVFLTYVSLITLSLITPTRPPFRRRLLRIVLRFFGYCPRAGLFAATTLSRFWKSVATNASGLF